MAEGVAFLARMKAEAVAWVSFTEEDDALLDELGVNVETKKVRGAGRPAKNASSPASKGRIQRFVERAQPPAAARGRPRHL